MKRFFILFHWLTALPVIVIGTGTGLSSYIRQLMESWVGRAMAHQCAFNLSVGKTMPQLQKMHRTGIFRLQESGQPLIDFLVIIPITWRMVDKIRYLSCFVLTYWVLLVNFFICILSGQGKGLVEWPTGTFPVGGSQPDIATATPFYGSFFYDILLIITIISIYLGYGYARGTSEGESSIKQNMEQQTEVLHHNIIRLEQRNRKQQDEGWDYCHDSAWPEIPYPFVGWWRRTWKNYDTMPTKQLSSDFRLKAPHLLWMSLRNNSLLGGKPASRF